MKLHEIPMYKSYDVVGYTFACDIYCVGDCITRAVDGSDPQSGLLAHVEQRLDEIAAERGIDRDRQVHDSNDFPHVIRASDEFDYTPRCITCGGVLDDESDDDESDD
jgi:hypothetical protein